MLETKGLSAGVHAQEGVRESHSVEQAGTEASCVLAQPASGQKLHVKSGRARLEGRRRRAVRPGMWARGRAGSREMR